MAATLAFDISAAKGTVRLTSGKLFRGGEYRLALTLDGKAVTDEVAMVRIYGDVRSDTRGDEICVAEATASDDGYVVKADTEAIERLFTIHAGAEIVPVRVVVYVTEAIVADGRTMLYWSPTMAIVDGKPIDTRGEKGDDGYTPVKGKDYFDGKDGEPGPKGDDGHTPEKGVDYFDGKDGEDGEDGEGAYQAAVRGGYVGDEATFIADLSKVSSAREAAERAEKAAEICEELLQSCDDAAAAVDESVATLNQDVTRISNLQAEVNQAIAAAVDAKENAAYHAEEAKGWWDSAEEAAIYADDAMQRAESARDRAETAKGDAVKAQEEASKSAEQASTSAENAAQSATTASNKAQEAKESALTAVNATALKVDQRINTEDNSEFPLIVMVDKDVYKFIAPKGATNTTACRYCCDGTAHYFGFLSGYTRGDLYEYDDSLKFVRKVSGVRFGQKFYGDPYALSYDFCTKLHNIVYKKDEQGNDVVEREYDAYYIRNCENPYTTQYIRKYDESGTELAYVVVPNELSYGRVCRNERTNHLIFFSLFTDEATGEKQMGYTIYDADLNKIGERRIDAKYDSSFSWLQHLNIVGNTTLISFAPKDETLTALFYLDENDVVIPVTGLADRYGEFIIRGSGKFTDIDSTATGRIGKMYIVPRMFYDYRTYNTLQHVIIVTNGARICKLLVDSSGDTRYAITADYYGGNRAIKTATVPDSRYDALSLFFANGSGSTTGSSSFYQPMANLSETGIVTKAFDTYKAPGGYTEFAPDPFPNTSNFPRGVTGNAHPTSDTKATPRAYQLYPAGNYGQAGGAIMFTI